MAAQPSILVFAGSDEARVKEAALEAVGRLTPPDASEFANDIVDGQVDNADGAEKAVFQTIQAIETLPFFGGPKVVWLKSANFLGDSVTGNAQTTLDALARLQARLEAGLPSDVTLVLSAPAIDKRRSFFKSLEKLAQVESLDKTDISKEGWERKLAPLVRQRARALGLDLPADVAEFFVAMVGEETRRLDSELDKLLAYIGPRGQVAMDDVRAVVSRSRGGVVFEIANALGKRELARALASLQHFLDLNESPVSIMRAAIIPKLRNLLAARDLLATLPARAFQKYDPNFKQAIAALPETERAHLPRTKAGELSLYPLFLAVQDSRNFTLEELVEALDACLEADRQLVNTGIDAPVVLSQFLVRILARKRPGKSAAAARAV
jgi:DNA polymerase III subunit delta